MKNTSLALAVCLLASALPSRGDEDRPDMHFRPFGIEPADRTEWGHGHLVGGLDRELKPERGTRHRTTLPLEATLGLPAGFSVVMGLEGGAHTVFDDGHASSAASREGLLKYSLPEWKGVHFAVMTGLSRLTGGDQHTHSRGYALTIDTPVGDLGFGQSWDRKRPVERHGGRETGINLFRLGLGPDGRWGVGGEVRRVLTGNDERLNHWLFGVARIVGRGLLADVAIGGTTGDNHARRLTAGLSWFF